MKRSKNTILLIALIILLGGFVLSKVFRSPSLESNLDEHLLTLDTASINAIHINPASNKGEIRLVRSGKNWEAQFNGSTSKVETAQVKNALRSLREIHPERLVTRKKEKWQDYKVDSTGTHVKVYTGQNDPSEFWIGKTSGGGTTVRLEGDDKVYEVKESLESSFNKPFSSWRDKTFLRVDPDVVSKVTFKYPADSSFVLEKSGTKWAIENSAADSTKVRTYLNRFRSQNLSEFKDDFPAADSPKFVITLFQDANKILELQGWTAEDNKWAVSSSLQPGVYFSSDNKTLMNNLFAGKETFTK